MVSMTRLQEDLLNDFKDQRQIIIEQVELFDPLATALRKPAAQKLASRAWLIIAEIVCYLASAGMIAFTVSMNRVYPFSALVNVRYIRNADDLKLMSEAEHFSIAIHAMAALLGLLFYIVARMTRRIRLKNNVLRLAGTNMKILMGQHLKRKAATAAIEQRHFLDLPSFAGTVSVNATNNITAIEGD